MGRIIGYLKSRGVLVSGPGIGKAVPLESWADGFRLTLNWILDFYAWAMKAKAVSNNGKIKGILLIDEIEQHIHPSLQTNFLLNLCKHLPDIQIFVTTHSPIVAIGAKTDELVALKRNGEHIEKVEPPNIRGYSAEDMLVDEKLFDTQPYSPEINSKLLEYRKLIDIPKNQRKPTESSRLKTLAKELLSQQIIEKTDDQLSRLLNEIREKYEV